MTAPWLSSQLQSRALNEDEQSTSQAFNAAGRNLEAASPSALKKFGWDITAAARAGEVDPVVGRSDEVGQTIESLLRRTKNNAVLIGEPGVGKTAIALGLAALINSGNVPGPLRGRRIVALDMTSMVAGTRFRGEFEERIRAVITEVEDSQRQIILFIDELHTIVGAGAAEGALDASNILKPALARGGLQLIGATTIREYRSHIERDAALERRFQPIMVDEPSVQQTIEILHALRERYEDHHGLRVSDEALVAVAELSDRYFIDRRLPDKAIDVLDRALAHVVMMNHQRDWNRATEPPTSASWETRALIVAASDVQQVVERMTGAPALPVLNDGEQLGARLAQRVVGQSEAIETIVRVIRDTSSGGGLRTGRRPRASFIFRGPPGVGKTEMAYALSQAAFDSAGRVLRFDMRQFQDRHSAARLIGAAPGLVGHDRPGELIDGVRRAPHSLVLFDDLDHAHPEVVAVLTSMLERGTLQDSRGSIASFADVLVVMTMQGSRGADADDGREPLLSSSLHGSVSGSLSDRVDAVVEFAPLEASALRGVAKMLSASLVSHLDPLVSSIELAPRMMDRLEASQEGSPRGAWDLVRTFRDWVEPPVATWRTGLDDGHVGHRLVIDVNDDGIIIVEDGVG